MSLPARKRDGTGEPPMDWPSVGNQPIVVTAISGLRGGEGTPYFLDATIATELAGTLDAMRDGPELGRAVRDLWMLARWLDEERNSPEARDAIVAVIGDAIHRLWQRGGDQLEVVADVVMGSGRRR